jgi:hypothetical protein
MLEESLELWRKAGDERGMAQAMPMLLMGDAQAGRWVRVVARLEEVVSIWRRLGDRLHLAFDLVWLGFAYGRVGRLAEGRAAAVEALEVFQQADNATGLGIALVDLAFLAVWGGRNEDAIRLAAAQESMRRRVGGPPGAIGGLLEGDPAAEARAYLSPEIADRAWEEGLALTVEEAVALGREQSGR